MKAVSLWQPWATLMALGKKRVETRGWGTSHRGELAIHGARRCEHQLIFEPTFKEALNGVFIPCGYIVAVVNLTDIRPVEWVAEQEFFNELERAFGDYSPGRYGWITENVRMLKNPVACWGHQQIWNLLPLTEAEVRKQL